MLPGMMIPYAAAAIPTGYFLCDGQAISRTTYAALFLAIGTTYGIGDGATTFNIPDCRGRAVIGAGTGAGLTPRARGDVGGAESVALAATDIPAHVHAVGVSDSTGSGGAAVKGDSGMVSGSFDTGSTAATTNPAIMPPFAVAGWLIKY
jgi:microcystin-dependent protein